MIDELIWEQIKKDTEDAKRAAERACLTKEKLALCMLGISDLYQRLRKSFEPNYKIWD